MKTLESLRPDLTPLPDQLKSLPVFRGYPVPWFVAWPNGPDADPEFRTADGEKFRRAIKERRCWTCGERLGANLAFVLGPMCGITRTTSEPPNHRACALWSMLNCPFLTRPEMERREGNLPAGTIEAAGCPIHRNPGVALLWVTRSFEIFPDQDQRPLISVGEPIETLWFAEGRKATRAEIDFSVAGGLPHLEKLAREEGEDALREFEAQIRRFELCLP
jgi:hypothetical protein